MTRVPSLALIAYVLALVVVVADQALKYWVLSVHGLVVGDPQPLIGPLRLTLVWNRGFSFGLLNIGQEWTRWVLSAFSIAVCGALAVWAWRVDKRLLAVAIGLVMGGAIGNVVDRLRLGAVTDFIDANGLWFPWVFNLADSAVTIGSVLLIWDLFVAPRKSAGA